MLEAFDEDRGVPRLQRGPAAQGGPDFREVSAVSNADIDKVGRCCSRIFKVHILKSEQTPF